MAEESKSGQLYSSSTLYSVPCFTVTFIMRLEVQAGYMSEADAGSPSSSYVCER